MPMIRIKHFLDAVESEDRDRIWVEPIGVTKDLQEMCSIHHVLSHLGPPMKIWNWFSSQPERYEEFLRALPRAPRPRACIARPCRRWRRSD